jgi:dihydrofolate reductase
MRSLTVFNNITLDGYFTGPNGDFSWAHDPEISPPDPEFDAFVTGNAEGGGELLFGRVTYQMMAGYWPSAMARENDPVVAGRMNALPKVVFSRTLASADWSRTRLVKSDLVAAVRAMKAAPGDGMVILGSGSIVAQLAAAGLVDEYQLVVHPVALGAGRTLFEGVRGPLGLKLTQSRAFPGGKILLGYVPQR